MTGTPRRITTMGETMPDARTARDEAIEVIARAWWRLDGWLDDDFEEKGSLHRHGAQVAVDALSGDLYACLAIDKGGLEQVGWRFERPANAGPRHGLLGYYSGEAGHADHERLYRLTSPETAP